MVDSSWRGAEAWHFYILTLRQLYSGFADDAATTSIALQQYEDILEPEKIYSLQARVFFWSDYPFFFNFSSGNFFFRTFEILFQLYRLMRVF